MNLSRSPSPHSAVGGGEKRNEVPHTDFYSDDDPKVGANTCNHRSSSSNSLSCSTERSAHAPQSVKPPTAPLAFALHHPTEAVTTNVISFDNTKAGLSSVDKAETEAIIKAASEGSSFYLNEQRKSEARQRRVEAMLRQSKIYDTTVLPNGTLCKKIESRVAEVEREMEVSRRFDRIFVHVDMDMFYAAVEEKKNPNLRGVPFGVGSNQMLSTTNYIARQYGVRSGMPGFIGKKLCPDLLIVPLNFASYKAEATSVRAVVTDYDPHYCSLGWDELTMELSAYIAAHYPDAVTMEDRYAVAAQVVEECRRRVREATQLTCSAGIAPTGTLAKIASNYNKPNGQHVLQLLTREDVMRFLYDLPVRTIPGVGKSQEAILAGLGVHKVGEIYAQRHRLCYLITEKTFSFLLAASLGLSRFYEYYDEALAPHEGDNPPDAGRKSVGQEHTFNRLGSRAALHAIAAEALSASHRRLQRDGLYCGQVVLKLKHRSFQVKQHSRNVFPSTDDLEVLRRIVNALLLPIADEFADYRLLGVRLEKLVTREELETTQRQAARQATLTDFFRRDRGALKRERDAPTEDSKDDDVVMLGPSQYSVGTSGTTATPSSAKRADDADLVHTIASHSPSSLEEFHRSPQADDASVSDEDDVIIVE